MFEEEALKAITKKLSVCAVLTTMAFGSALAAPRVDRGSVQAAVDSAKMSGVSAASSRLLSDVYQLDRMNVQWPMDQVATVAALAGQSKHQRSIAEKESPFLIAQQDVQTTVFAIQLINRAKGLNFPQQTATSADLQAFKKALEANKVQEYLAELTRTHALIPQLARIERQYRDIVRAGGWKPVPATEYRTGTQSRAVRLLKDRLNAEGYQAGSGDTFDSTTEFAVKMYQSVQGLPLTGAVDKSTRQHLNVSAWQRLQTIRANLARFKAQNQLSTDNNVIVNIPAFKGEFYNGGKQVWSDRVIVGKTNRRTPQLESNIERVVFNPSWYVPVNLARRDVLPRASRDPSYWHRMGYEAYNSKGEPVAVQADENLARVVAENNLRIKQPPGPRNALGQVKFLFPNKYSVYLHDTPNKKLFSRDVRTFSSGCVRVNEPLRFAQILLRHQTKRANKSLLDHGIDQVLASNKTRSVTLKRPVQVSTIYLTAEPQQSGRVRFHKDVYRYDTAELASRYLDSQPQG